MKNRALVIFLTVVVVATFVAAGVCQALAAERVRPVKIGVIRGFTGAVAAIGAELSRGVDWVLSENGYEIAGRPIIVIEEDEGETPEKAVAKAKKLVEQDKVDVILGPLLAHSTMAVQGYLKMKGVPQLAFGPSDEPVSKHAFWSYATGRGGAYPGGQWAYDVLGARKATFLYTDYLFSHQLRDGFKAGFEARGGTIVADIPVPWPEIDMAPYLVKIKDTDVVVPFLVPAAATFVQQYREFGLKVPVFFMAALMYEEPLLRALGDAALGMYGTTWYSAEIDTPENKRFVAAFKNKYGYYPAMGTIQGYWPARMYVEALKATRGNADPKKITDALLAIKSIDTPAGTLSYTSGRTSVQDIYILQVVKKDRYAWKVLKKYSGIMPR